MDSNAYTLNVLSRVLFPQEGHESPFMHDWWNHSIATLVIGDHVSKIGLPTSTKHLQFLHPSGFVPDGSLFAGNMPHLPI
jgi:hypothetical protein